MCVCVCRYTHAREIISTHAHSMLLINRERENKNRATISSVSVFSRAKSRAWKRPLSFIHVRFFSSPKSARFRLHGKRALGSFRYRPDIRLYKSPYRPYKCIVICVEVVYVTWSLGGDEVVTHTAVVGEHRGRGADLSPHVTDGRHAWTKNRHKINQ